MNEEEVKEVLRHHPELKDEIEYVSGSRNKGKAYWRFKPSYRFNPSKAQLEARLVFAEAGYSSYGMKGLREVHGVMMPPTNKVIQRRLKGKKFTSPTKHFNKIMEKALKKMAERLERKKKLKVTA